MNKIFKNMPTTYDENNTLLKHDTHHGEIINPHNGEVIRESVLDGVDYNHRLYPDKISDHVDYGEYTETW